MPNDNVERSVQNSLRMAFEQAKISKPTLFSLPRCFCGGKAKINTWEVVDDTFYQVVCDKCELETDWFCSMEEVTVSWADLQIDIEENINGKD